MSNIFKDYSAPRKGNPYGKRRSVAKKTTKESRQRRESVLESTTTDRKRKRISQSAKSTETQNEGKPQNKPKGQQSCNRMHGSLSKGVFN